MFSATYRGTIIKGTLESFVGGDGTVPLSLEFSGGLTVEVMNPSQRAVKLMNAMGKVPLVNAEVNLDTGLIESNSI